MPQYFNNRLLVMPQVEVAVNDSGMQPTNVTTNPLITVAILGYSTQGKPGVPTLVTNLDQALATFGQGTLLDGITRAFAPAPGGGGAPQIFGVRVNNAQSSAVTLNDTASAACLALTTQDAGQFTKSMYAAVIAATNPGSSAGQVSATGVPYGARKVTTGYAATTAVGDNLGYVCLQVGCAVASNTIHVAPITGSLAVISATGVQSAVLTVGTNFSGYQISVGTQLIVDTAGKQETVTVTAVASASGTTVTITANFTQTHSAATGVITTSPYLCLKGTAPTDNAAFALVNYASLSALAAAANATSANWQITVPFNMNQAPGALTPISGASLPTVLDVITNAGTGIPQGPLTVTQNVGFVSTGSFTFLTGIAQAVTDYLNGSNDPYFTATRTAFAVSSTLAATGGTIPATTSQNTYASGGADDANGGSLLANSLTVLVSDWQNALSALQGVDTPLFVLMTDNAAIHSLGDTHAALMAGSGKMERLHICGGLAGETTAQAVARAQNLNSFRSVVCYPGVQDYDLAGNLGTRPPYYLAAMVAGLASNLGEGVSLTNKLVRISGLETRTLSNGGPFTQADYDALIQGGVLGVQYRPGRNGYAIAQGITTWLQDAKFTKREISTRRIVDRVVRDVRDKLNDEISNNVGPDLLNTVMADVEGVLSYYAQRGFLVGDDTNPPYGSISASVQPGRPDTIAVNFQISPAVPANYILATVHATAYGSVLQS